MLFLDHDGDSRIVFSTLESFLGAVRKAIGTSGRLRSLHPESGVLLADQPGLNSLVAGLYDGNYDCDGPDVLLSLIPSLDLLDKELLQRLVVDRNFYLCEAVGNAIASRPRLDLKPIAAACQQHTHPQAAQAGARAMAAIAALQ